MVAVHRFLKALVFNYHKASFPKEINIIYQIGNINEFNDNIIKNFETKNEFNHEIHINHQIASNQ